jgi:hypothetical protein
MKNLLLMAMLLTLTGCFPEPEPAPALPPAPAGLKIVRHLRLTGKQLAAVKHGVAQSADNPESARFSHIIAGVNGKKTLTVCGLVTTKNDAGQRIGPRPFLGMMVGTSFVPTRIGGGENGHGGAGGFCQRIGLPLSPALPAHPI